MIVTGDLSADQAKSCRQWSGGLLSLSTLLVLENNGYIKLPQVDPQQNEICCVAE
jgi:hypothetical protein